MFNVPRSTVYGHLDKKTVGARPRGRPPTGHTAPPESGSRNGRKPAAGAEVVKV
jgi:hypothetical protein